MSEVTKTGNGSGRRLWHFDLLRVVAIFAMVMLHVNFNPGLGTRDWNVANIYSSFVHFCVPVFVMVSGAFFLDPERQYPPKKLARHVIRLVCAFIFWSLLYALFNVHEAGQFNLKEFFWDCFYGPFHFWFIFMIISLYLVVPFLRKITADKRLTEYFLLLSFVFTILLFPVQTYHPALLRNNFMTLVCGYSVYFVLGYYLKAYPLGKGVKTALYVLGVLSLFLTVSGTRTLSARAGAMDETLRLPFSPTIFFWSASIFLFFRDVVSKADWTETGKKVIGSLSKCSFGIYLIHVFVIRFVKDYVVPQGMDHIALIPLTALIVFIISYFIIFLISKIPVLNKYIV